MKAPRPGRNRVDGVRSNYEWVSAGIMLQWEPLGFPAESEFIGQGQPA